MPEVFHTVKSRATILGVEQEKILGWIHSGELLAINIAERTSGRPRWRIPDAAWEEFLKSRSNRVSVSPPTTPRRRRKRDTDVIEFY